MAERSLQIPLSDQQMTLYKSMISACSGNEYRAVSFRMSDILTVKPFSEYYDLFIFMEEDFRELSVSSESFVKLRIAAEEAAEKKCGSSSLVSLEMIYDILMKKGDISPSSRDRLMARECELAVYFTFPRSLGREMYSAAKRSKKNIILTADTIYPRETILKILKNCGYTGYNALIIPHEQKLSGGSELFSTIIKKSKVPENRLIHFGWDVEQDVEVPIMSGSKAMLLSSPVLSMIRSGRLRGYIQSLHIYDIDSPELLPLHCVLGLYSDYCFDVPQNKLYLSDFCGSEFLIGFIVLGPLSLINDYKPSDDFRERLIDILSGNEKTAAGRDAFIKAFDTHFRGHTDKYGSRELDLPFEFFVQFSSAGDRAIYQQKMEPADFQHWADISADPKLAPVYGKTAKKSALSKLADRMFPPGTKVRNMTDGILFKMKNRAMNKGKKK